MHMNSSDLHQCLIESAFFHGVNRRLLPLRNDTFRPVLTDWPELHETSRFAVDLEPSHSHKTIAFVSSSRR